MMTALRTLISGVTGQTKRTDREEDRCRVAIAGLLIRTASIDTELSPARSNKLHSALKTYFGSDDVATAALKAQGAKAAREAVDLYHFTRTIKLLVNEEGCRRIIRMMWEVIHADGSVSPLESNIVWRAADLLGVSSRQRIELRIASERAALAGSA